MASTATATATATCTSESKLNSKLKSGVILAAVEGGGTTFVVTIAILHPVAAAECIPHTRFEILQQSTIPSSSQSPEETVAAAASFFREHAEDGGYRYAGLGIATFGPVGVDPSRPQSYGRICASSPKREWRNVDLLRPLLRACGDPPHRLDTDVNAPAMAEFQFHRQRAETGEACPLTSLAYITVGTGIGVGMIVNGLPVHGMMHPEAGHVPIRPLQDTTAAAQFQGYSWGTDACPFHGKYTVEGTACSVALTERLLQMNSDPNHNHGDAHIQQADAAARDKLKDLPDDHPIWDHAANALANLCVTLILVTSIEKIVIGGGIMKRGASLYAKIRHRTKTLLNGYLSHLEAVSTDQGLDMFVTPSIWSDNHHASAGPGLVGALVLAQKAVEDDPHQHQTNKPIIHHGVVSQPDGKCHSDRRYPSQFWKGTIVGAIATIVASSLAMLAVTRNRTR